jgi:hypothetical protein
MDMHPVSELSDTWIDADDRRVSALRQMSAEQLLHLGTRQVVYLKSGMCDGAMLFVLYGADGSPLMVAEDVETAAAMAVDCGLNFVAVH